ncbi:MAG: DNA-processing protein DprA [Lacisediminihabitans sp.]
MTIFGLKETVVAPLLRAVAGEDLPSPELSDRFARATWTGIAEPGDRIAGALVAALGAGPALTTVVERWDAGRVIEALAAADAELPTDEEVAQAMKRWAPRLSSSTALTALKQAARYSVRLAVPSDPSWPSGFDDLGPHAPMALWVRGNDSVLATAERSIALVGARAATGYGEHVTMEASAGLVDRGYTIVSGAAYGIDGMAHRAALASSGQTIAFLAGGVDRFYPSGHDALLARIVEVGVVVSELPCGAPPTKWRFLQRNRLIAAASQATVVLEAGWRSGSLNTAGHAAALGRPLGAVPGPVTSAASAGCHRLIREFGASCVTNADEMAELAPFDRGAPTQPAQSPAGQAAEAQPPSDHIRVLDALSTRSARPVDDVAGRAGLSVSQVQAVLGLLELEGATAEREGGWVKKQR